MANFYTELNKQLSDFIQEQQIFFVATAADEGRINLSPKGMDTFHIHNNNNVAFLNLTGSGNETAAHLEINSRITIMFCSFSKTPMILRLYGTGKVISPSDNEWQASLANFKSYPGARQIITIQIDSVQTSCGFAVPIAEAMVERDTLAKWAESKGEQGIREYWKEKNQTSIDGHPTHILDGLD